MNQEGWFKVWTIRDDWLIDFTCWFDGLRWWIIADSLLIMIMDYGWSMVDHDDGLWWIMMDYDDGLWWIMMDYDGLWWIMMDSYDGLWWIMMDYPIL